MTVIFFYKTLAVILKGGIFAVNNFNNLNQITMKKVVKRSLKIIAVAAFMVALGYGVSTNSKVSELSSLVNLSALSSVSAQGENTTPYHACPGGTEECVRVGMGNRVYIFHKP